MHTADFDYHLPVELIAQEPLPERDGSRLLVARRSGGLEHRAVRELPGLLRAGDVLVLNDTKVIPARLLGRKVSTGGKVELLLVRPDADISTVEALASAPSGAGAVWRCLGQASKGLKVGSQLEFGAEGELRAEVLQACGDGEYRVRLTSQRATLDDALRGVGALPLPPYIDRPPVAADAERYQTVYAAHPGSVAAPTAGLHFTPALLADLERAGVRRAFITLEVGPGTFLPVREGDVADHRMHAERFQVSPEASQVLRSAKRDGQRLVAVGTTVVRALESRPALTAGPGETRLFITPGFEFQVVDALITNFHLPRSTLLMLVCAFLGREETLAAYQTAVGARYRFFSYGDAMLVER